ncbi:hypothetical protein FB451DRAFT_1365943 [Mycena latifolia]|nr:hypothetical protein FB451DRAFT_1365943 [Mycena latifolia]
MATIHISFKQLEFTWASTVGWPGHDLATGPVTPSHQSNYPNGNTHMIDSPKDELEGKLRILIFPLAPIRAVPEAMLVRLRLYRSYLHISLSPLMATVSLSDATIAQDDRTTRNFFLAGIVLLCYDHTLTLGKEVEYIWAPGGRRSSFFYIFVRYFALCANMGMISLTFATFDSETCDRLNKAHGLLIVAQQLLVGFTLILRVLALYAFDRRVMFALATLALVVVAVAAVCAALPFSYLLRRLNIRSDDASGPSWPPGRLRLTRPASPAAIRPPPNRSLAVAWEAQLAGDVVLLGFTLHHGYKGSRSDVFFRAGSLWRVLVRDGAMYFGPVASHRGRPIPPTDSARNSGSSASRTSQTSSCIMVSVTMICRLMLNLHDATAVRPGLSQFSLNTTELATDEFVVLRPVRDSIPPLGDRCAVHIVNPHYPQVTVESRRRP